MTDGASSPPALRVIDASASPEEVAAILAAVTAALASAAGPPRSDTLASSSDWRPASRLRRAASVRSAATGGGRSGWAAGSPRELGPSVSEVWAAEVAAVGPDSVTVTFVTEPEVSVETTVGDTVVRTTGPFHFATVDGLAPDTEHALAVEGVAVDDLVPAAVRTLAAPSGRPLATVATVNDVHFGETVCGMIHDTPEAVLGPWVRSGPGEPPYPVTMNDAAAVEIDALGPDVVLAKGDLTCVGSDEEYQQFLDAYARFGDRLHHVRGNHDAMLDPTLAVEGAPYTIELGGATLAVLDTVRPTEAGGRITAEQIGWLDETTAATSGPVLVFGHHQIWDIHSPARPADYFGVDPDSSEAFAAVVGRRENIAGYFAGHTHRNRVRRFAESRDVPFVEVGAVKEYMGVWAEYRIHAGGYTQVLHRLRAPAAMSWSERTRHLYGGIYPAYARGPLDHRCFTHPF